MCIRDQYRDAVGGDVGLQQSDHVGVPRQTCEGLGLGGERSARPAAPIEHQLDGHRSVGRGLAGPVHERCGAPVDQLEPVVALTQQGDERLGAEGRRFGSPAHRRTVPIGGESAALPAGPLLRRKTPSMFTLLIVIHVLSAILLLGPTYLYPFLPRIVDTSSVPVLTVMKQIEQNVMIFLVVQLLTGVGIIFSSHEAGLRDNFGKNWWLQLSMTLFIIAAGIGSGYNTPRVRK